jgi:hypothetical protein
VVTQEDRKTKHPCRVSEGQLRGKDSSGNTIEESPEDPSPTLAELGIPLKLSAESQALAKLCRLAVIEKNKGGWNKPESCNAPEVLQEDPSPTLAELNIPLKLLPKPKTLAKLSVEEWVATR